MQSLNFNTTSLVRELHYFDYNDLASGITVFNFNAEQSQFVALQRDGFTCLPIASYFYNGLNEDVNNGLELQILDLNGGGPLSILGATGSIFESNKYLYTQHLLLGQNDIVVNTFSGNLGLYWPDVVGGFPTPSTYGLFWWFIFTYVPKFPPV